MKCISCGLPLSPSRTTTNCPRCGTPISSGQKATPAPMQQQYQQVNWGNAGVVDAGTPLPDYQQAQNVQGSPSNIPLPQMPEYRPGVPQQIPPQTPQQVIPPRNSRKTKLSFAVAGLCVLTGGLILVIVFIIAMGSGNNTVTTNHTSNVSTPTNATTATVALSPTANVYPGQQYIYNAQMSSAIDPNSLQPTQLTTTFKTNQKIYVTFQLHPPQSGAYCLIWYLNGKQVTHYSYPVSANSRHSYGYSIYGGTGAAYVEIYWASTTQCTDKILAQHVEFTVTT